jgi:DNA-directed RNA polymerase specialized sigma24 family protein
MFRGNVTHYKVHGFDDVVIFVHDVDRCLAQLNPHEGFLIRRIAIQEYTQAETAEMLQLPIRTLVRRYERSLDTLTRLFLDRRLLQPLAACQDVEKRK